VRRLPGVTSAALVSTPPGGGYEGDDVFTIPEHPTAASVVQNDAMYRSADPEYFKVMQIPLLSGRVFTDQERLTRDHYIIISKKLADQYFSGDNPIGRHINVSWDEPKPENYEIIGVVGDTLYDVAQAVRPTMYFPMLSGLPNQVSGATIMVRTAGDPLLLSIPVQKQVAALDPSLPVYDVLTMQQILGKTTASQSFSATLTLAFALLSLLLAAIGLYGVLSYLIAQRITEIGIRIALGAQRSQVLSLVLLDGLRPVFLGLLIGLAGGAVAGTLIRSILFGTSPYDPVVFASMIGSLLLTAVVACAIPAIRALRIDPMQALRTE
jgi:predicted permease